MNPKSNKFRHSNLPNLDDIQDEFDQYDTPADQRKNRLYVVICTKCKRKYYAALAYVGQAVAGKCYGALRPNGFRRPPEHSWLPLPLTLAVVVEEQVVVVDH